MATKKFTIGWACALQEEYDAACRMLDEEIEDFDDFDDDELDINDDNVYTLGVIGAHHVVIGYQLGARYGTNTATQVANDMACSFPHLKCCLMVGIGGGAPTKDNDVRLGDVVVGIPNKPVRGVVQYDLGKRLSGCQYQQTGLLSIPPDALLTVAMEIMRLFDDVTKPGPIEEHLKRMKMDDFPRPPSSYLFRSDYQHVEGANCDACNKFKAISRPYIRQRKIKIHHGTIVSGNAIIKDPKLRDQLANDPNVKALCFETAAAGLGGDTPALVIRGICDYSDSHMNSDWHGYAALTAAAYAREVLLTLPAGRVDAMPAWVERMNQNLTGIQPLVAKTKTIIETPQEDYCTHQIRTWLSAPDPSTNLAKAQAIRHPGTGKSFLTSYRFEDWRLGLSPHLWLHGIPGSGKTMFTSSIIQHFREEIEEGREIKLLYFFFDFNDASKRTLDQLLRSLLTQLYSQSRPSQAALEVLKYKFAKGQGQPTTHSLAETFLKMTRAVKVPIYIVIDGLDECQTGKALLLWIQQTMSAQYQYSDSVQFIVASREQDDISNALDAHIAENSISIEEGLLDADIKTYIRGRLRESLFERWSSHPDVLDDIENKLMKKTGGMFRWVACQLDALQTYNDLPALQQALASLPQTLDETYARILRNIGPGHEDDAIRLLQFLCFSERPLTMAEAVDAITVNVSNKPHFTRREKRPLPQDFTRIYSILLFLTPDVDSVEGGMSMRIQLADFSVKEYLLSDRVEASFRTHLVELTARATITQVCLTYIDHVSQAIGIGIRDVETSSPLARYSAVNWMKHARVAEDDPKTLTMITEFLLENPEAYSGWGTLFNPDKPWSEANPFPSDEIKYKLYYAARAGLARTAGILIDNGADVDSPVGFHGTALQAACARGHDSVVRVLLERGANVNLAGGRYGDALSAACFRGDKKIIEILLDAGACGEEGDAFGALQVACEADNVEVVELLLEHLDRSTDNNLGKADKGLDFPTTLRKRAETLLRRKRERSPIYTDAAIYGPEDRPGLLVNDPKNVFPGFLPAFSSSDTMDIAHCTWNVDLGKSTESPFFTSDNDTARSWQIVLTPTPRSADGISIFLRQSPKSTSMAGDAVEFAIVIWKPGDPSRYIARVTKHHFHARTTDWGFKRFCAPGRLVQTLGNGDDNSLSDLGRMCITVCLRVIRPPSPPTSRYVSRSSFMGRSNPISSNSPDEIWPIGLKNQGTTGWLNVILQSLYPIHSMTQSLNQVPTAANPTTDIAWALQRLFHAMKTSPTAVSTQELTDAFGWGPSHLIPQDAQDQKRKIMHQIEKRMDDIPVSMTLADLFTGFTTTHVVSLDSDKGHPISEMFQDLQLPVRGLRSLHESLHAYTQPRTTQLHGEPADIGTRLHWIPPVLNLHLRRFEYNPVIGDMEKVPDYMEFPEEIDLAPYMTFDNDPDEEESVYSLVSVIVHEGILEGGLYYIYMRPTPDGPFFRIHDEDVRPVTVEEVFQAGFGGDCGSSEGWSKSAYMLCYCQKAALGQIYSGGVVYR